MTQVAFSKEVKDSVAKVNEEVAVGEDLAFQERWWRFERAVWILFALIIVLDLLGAFGRGPLSHARSTTADGSMDVQYERIERTGTPAIMQVSFGPSAIRNGEIKLFASESIVKQLGNQRIIPSPQSTKIGDGGLTYTFPASTVPASIEFALQPSGPGVYPYKLQVVGSEAIQANVVVVP